MQLWGTHSIYRDPSRWTGAASTIDAHAAIATDVAATTQLRARFKKIKFWNPALFHTLFLLVPRCNVVKNGKKNGFLGKNDVEKVLHFFHKKNSKKFRKTGFLCRP
jgi:hypothetical protein